MHFQADVMAHAVGEVLAQRLAVAIFAVSVDVVVGDLVEAVGRVLPIRMPGLIAAMAAFCAPSTMS